MSPGARTIPAAIVLPTAADIPNHMPRTLRRRPRLRGAAGSLRAELDTDALDVEALDVEDRSGGFGNGRASGTLRTLAMIIGAGEKASRKSRSGEKRSAY